jgi:hypothetical protein
MDTRVILHLDGQDQNHEAKNLQAVNPRCSSCNGFIEPDRLRWFARKKIKAADCGPCGFEQRAKRSQPQP